MAKSCARLYASTSNLRARFFESEPFLIILNDVCGKPKKIPTHKTVLCYVKHVYDDDKESIKNFLVKNFPPAVSIIFDLWSEPGPLKRNFLNIQLQFSLEFEIQNISLAIGFKNQRNNSRFLFEQKINFLHV